MQAASHGDDAMLRTIRRLVASPESAELIALLLPDDGIELFDADLVLHCSEPVLEMLDDLLCCGLNDPAFMLHERLKPALQHADARTHGRWYRFFSRMAPVATFSELWCDPLPEEIAELGQARQALERAAALLVSVQALRRRGSRWMRHPRSRRRPVPLVSLASARRQSLLS